MVDQYYVLVDGKRGSKQPHTTLASAYTEARRLFDLEGQARRVFVLQTIGAIEPVKKEVAVEENGGRARQDDADVSGSRKGPSPLTRKPKVRSVPDTALPPKQGQLVRE